MGGARSRPTSGRGTSATWVRSSRRSNVERSERARARVLRAVRLSQLVGEIAFGQDPIPILGVDKVEAQVGLDHPLLLGVAQDRLHLGADGEDPTAAKVLRVGDRGDQIHERPVLGLRLLDACEGCF